VLVLVLVLVRVEILLMVAATQSVLAATAVGSLAVVLGTSLVVGSPVMALVATDVD
jgi:hypothetical protein